MSTPRVFEAADGRLIQPCSFLAEIYRYRVFLLFWVRRNLVVRYRQTSIGPAWSILQPLLSGLVYAMVFSWMLRVQTTIPYVVFVVVNLSLWTYTARSVTTGTTVLVNNLDLVTRIQFPREFLPLGVWIESLVDLALASLVVAGFFIAYDVPVTTSILMVIPILIVHSILTLGLTLLTAAVTIAVRDLVYVAPLLLQLALYLSPIVYPLEVVPDAWRDLYLLNPMATIFAAYDEALFDGTFTLWRPLGITALVSLLMLTGSYRLFKRREWKLADIL